MCPSEPEMRNNYQDDDGCADEAPASVAKVFNARSRERIESHFR